jgi:hypothetical protein
MIRKIAEIAEFSRSPEEFLGGADDFCRKEIAAFQTLSVFVDRGFPTFCYVKNDDKLLLNLSIPWKSIAGQCIKERRKIVTYAPKHPQHYSVPAEKTGFTINHVLAMPLNFLNNTFGCVEFLLEREPLPGELEFFDLLGIYMAPIVYLQEWHVVERRKSHAIKNKAFLGMLNLSEDGVDEESRHIAVRDAFNEISALSEGFLKLSGIKFKMQKIDLTAIVRTVAEKLSKLAELNCRAVDVTEEFTPGLEVFCDESAIREEVLFNIVKNVWEEWERRGQEKRTIVFKTFRRNDDAVIEITDNAGGMAAETASRLFQPFESGKGLGRGMGMNIAYHIVKHHNGVMDFETRQGDGTVFRISLSTHMVDRRRFFRKRAEKVGISMLFEGRRNEGIIAEAGMGGLMAVFEITELFPQASDEVLVDIDFRSGRVEGIDAVVVRLEEDDVFRDGVHIKAALTFTGKSGAGKKEHLARALSED